MMDQHFQGDYTLGSLDDDEDNKHRNELENQQPIIEEINIDNRQQIGDAQQQYQNSQSSQKLSSSTSNIDSDLVKKIKKSENTKLDFEKIREDYKIFQIFSWDDINQVEKFLNDNYNDIKSNEVFYSFVLWILEKTEQKKEEKIQNEEIYPKLKCYVNFIQKNQNKDTLIIENVSQKIVMLLIDKLNDFKSTNLNLAISVWIHRYLEKLNPKLNYFIAQNLISLNQLESAEYYVEQALLFLDHSVKIRYLFVNLLFQCSRDLDFIQKEFDERIKQENQKKEYNIEYLQFCFQYLRSMVRLGNVEQVRKNLYLLGNFQIKDEHREFYKNNISELFNFVIFTNRLPYVLKLIEFGQNIETDKLPIDIQKFENDPTKFLIELFSCLFSLINQSSEDIYKPYLIIYYNLFVGQDYESLQHQVKNIFAFDILKKIEKKQRKTQIHSFIEKEYQILKPFVLKYFQDIQQLNQQLVLSQDYQTQDKPFDKKQREYYHLFLTTLKRFGQYENVVKIIDDGIVHFSKNKINLNEPNYLSFFKLLSTDENEKLKESNQSLYTNYQQIQEKIPIFIKQFYQSNGQFIQDLDFIIVSIDSDKRIIKNLQIFYDRAMCLAYLKKYKQSYETLLIIIAVIIKLEGFYSFNLLPSLSLLSEVSTYIQQKTLSHQCLKFKQFIMNDISQQDEGFEIQIDTEEFTAQ